ncbi:hypothetical protein PENTCL1PPCAC_95, partial [Pristionchus entomophagus]
RCPWFFPLCLCLGGASSVCTDSGAALMISSTLSSLSSSEPFLALYTLAILSKTALASSESFSKRSLRLSSKLFFVASNSSANFFFCSSEK